MSDISIFEPSVQQQAIFDWIENGGGSAIVEAVAGSGKTKTLVESLNYMSGKIFIGAYNKKIAEELQDRVGEMYNVKISTVHAAGFGYLKKKYPNAKLNVNKLGEIFDTYLCSNKEYEKYSKHRQEILTLVSFAKQSGVGIRCEIDDKEIWEDMLDHYALLDGFYDPESKDSTDILQLAMEILLSSNDNCSHTIDFDDMIYFPLIANLVFPKYDWVLADEVQDYSFTRREISCRMMKKNARFVGFGDRHQCIYAFSGADINSMDLIAEATEAVQLPLSVSYRCPKTVVETAKVYVPHIESHKDAIEGSVSYLKNYDALIDLVKPGNAILCRYNAPIVELAFSLIAEGIPAKIEGRDIAASLKIISKKMKAYSYNEFSVELTEYFEKCKASLKLQKKENLIEPLDDKVQCLFSVLGRVRNLHPAQMKKAHDYIAEELDNIFGSSVDARRLVVLSSIHKSKGLEWDKVFYLDSPNKRSLKDWEVAGEINLRYVAITRAKKELVFVYCNNK